MGRPKKIESVIEILTTDSDVELEALNPSLDEPVVANAPTIKIKEIQTKFNVHDRVQVIGDGAGSWSGGKKVKATSGLYYIISIMPAAPYCYQVGDSGNNTLGYFKQEALKRI